MSKDEKKEKAELTETQAKHTAEILGHIANMFGRFGVPLGLIVIFLACVHFWAKDETKDAIVRALFLSPTPSFGTGAFWALVFAAVLEAGGFFAVLARRLAGDSKEIKRMAEEKGKLQEVLLDRKLSRTDKDQDEADLPVPEAKDK